MAEEQVEELTAFQELLTEAYDVYRQITKKRNPSDAQWSKYLGVHPAAFNHWVNDNRRPNLISVLQLSKGLAKLDRHLHIDDIDQQFRWRVFDTLGMERIHVAPNSDLEYLVDNWDIWPVDLKDKVIKIIEADRRKHKRGGNNHDDLGNGNEDAPHQSGDDER